MNVYKARTRFASIVLTISSIGVAMSILLACETTPAPAVTTGSMSGVATATVEVQDAIMATKQAADKISEAQVSALETAAALTPAPHRFITAPSTPVPTPTIIMGLQSDCQPVGSTPAIFTSCWTGVVNGETLTVGAGVENDHNGPLDATQGVVIVYTGTTYIENRNMNVYSVPNQIGTVQITSVAGTRFTLRAVDLYSFRHLTPGPDAPTIIFDLATRQWVNTQGTPLPTLTPAPTQVP